MTEDEVRAIVREEIAIALRKAEIDGPHMARFRVNVERAAVSAAAALIPPEQRRARMRIA